MLDGSGNQLKKLEKIIHSFRLIDPEMPMQTALALVLVAGNENIGKETIMSDLADAIGIQQGSITRNVSNLSDWNYKKQKGLGLVKMEYDPMDQRRKCVTLTQKGKTFINQLIDVIK
jgi:DNA-binding MarR family transcriptional regulator